MTFENNIALQTTSDHNIEIVNVSIGHPDKGQVLIHVRATGICGSDIHFWKTGAIGELKVLGNCTLGHEAAGDIVGVGEGVRDVQVGDRVAIEPGIPCGNCFLCTGGNYNLCKDVQFIGVYPYHGSMQKYLIHDAKFIHKLPDKLSYEEGALAEPVSVAYHGIQRAELELGSGVFIAGAGPIGLAALLLASSLGACPIVISDVNASRLEFAKRLVPSVKTYQINPKIKDTENAAEIRKCFGKDEIDAPAFTLECTGIESSIITGAYVTRRSGTLTLIGVGKDTINNFPFMHLSLAEIDVKFINRYHDSWPIVIKLMDQGIIDVRPLITHRFSLSESITAMNVASDPSVHSIKVIIEDN
ncbi:uncharacterized protein PRCAT00001448001 [Priceomyces carsonii]|uniref:uncharacterized protein n=1 Tax=Priceomyces carsonii TaxID=28549 RepID=UPI002ED95AE1|nr:unnamed protein product [Priceomyces carsonii]